LEDALDTRERLRELLPNPLGSLKILGRQRQSDDQPVDFYDIAYLSGLGDDDHVVLLVVAVHPRLGAVFIGYYSLRYVAMEDLV
jgi:hypothetical protein